MALHLLHKYDVRANPQSNQRGHDSSTAAVLMKNNAAGSRPSSAGLRVVSVTRDAALSERAVENLQRVIDDQRKSSGQTPGLPMYVSAGRIRRRGADHYPDPPPSGGSNSNGDHHALPTLPAFQLQVSLMLDQQRAIMQRALHSFNDNINSSISKIDERLAAVETVCARLEAVIHDELRAADADHRVLKEKLDAVGEERDRYLRRIVNTAAPLPRRYPDPMTAASRASAVGSGIQRRDAAQASVADVQQRSDEPALAAPHHSNTSSAEVIERLSRVVGQPTTGLPPATAP